jgi:hypothetical protein
MINFRELFRQPVAAPSAPAAPPPPPRDTSTPCPACDQIHAGNVACDLQILADKSRRATHQIFRRFKQMPTTAVSLGEECDQCGVVHDTTTLCDIKRRIEHQQLKGVIVA